MIRPRLEGLLIVLLLTVGGCASFAPVAARTVTSIGAVQLEVAAAARDVHLNKLKEYRDEIITEKAKLGCSAAVGESFPDGCDVTAWVAYRDEMQETVAAERRRWETFKKAMRTLAHALTTTSTAIELYEVNRKSIDLPKSLESLVTAWGAVVALLEEWGIKAPDLNLRGGS